MFYYMRRNKMKKIKYLIVCLFVMLAFFAFTACGVKEPTESDVEKALQDAGYLPGGSDDSDDEDNDEDEDDGDDEDADSEDDSSKEDDSTYTITLDKVKLNDDKDKATVEATVVVSSGSVNSTTGYKLTFKLKDDKTWKVKGDIEITDETTYELLGITDEDAAAVLSDDGNYCYLSTDSCTIYFYDADELSVKVNSHNVDNDELSDTANLTITGKTEEISYTLTMNATFNYSSYSNTWYAYTSTFELDGDPEFELNEELNDDDAAEMIKSSFSQDWWYGYYYYYFEDDSELTFDDFDSVTIKSHDFDSSSLSDKVTAEAVVKDDYSTKTITITADFTYNFSSGWRLDSSEVAKDYDSEFNEEYLFDLTSDDVKDALRAKDWYFKVSGCGYYTGSINISDFSFTDPELDGSNYAYSAVEYTFTSSDVTATVTATLKFYYDSSDGWSLNDWDDITTTAVTCDAIGTWSGKDSSGNPASIVISDTLNEDGYLTAVVAIKTDENGRYSWNAYVEYEPGDDSASMKIYFDDNAGWVTERTDGSYYGYDSFSGYVSGNTFAPSWSSWSFTKK
jgi:uncharacterized lipoprotein YehR (DUF1307 family)